MTATRETSATVRVPAKINLGLSVGRREPDGYHQLATVFHAVSLFDEVTVTPNDTGDVQLAVEGPYTDGVPLDETNIAVRAARLLA